MKKYDQVMKCVAEYQKLYFKIKDVKDKIPNTAIDIGAESLLAAAIEAISEL